MNRVVTKKGYNVSDHQFVGHQAPKTLEHIKIQANSVPSWGNMFQVDYKENKTILTKAILAIELGALSGTGSTNFLPASLWIDKMDVMQNGKILETHYGDEQFLRHQLWYDNPERNKLNVAEGVYSNSTQRIALAAAQTTYYINLDFYFSQCGGLPVLDNKDHISFRITLKSLLSIVNGGSSPACTIIGAQLLCRVQRLEDVDAEEMKLQIYKRPMHFKYSEVVKQSHIVPVNATSTTVTLSSLNGPVSHLMFVSRESDTLNTFNFQAIQDFEITSNGKNIVGGQVIKASDNLKMNEDQTLSNYLTEISTGESAQGAYVYLYSFSSDCPSTMQYGQSLGSYNFTGNENLTVRYVSGINETRTIDIFGFKEAVIEVTANGVNKREYKH